ncbi:Nitroreductase [Penicillium longicatenatum]|uniref:Nitroreductase n=1 Tax=Penicillium longicatenatum TaxID=1561947 RepID=UPI00254738AE|nr:Nitroreductase [Penicillium longicatenatum]KAJ5631072.1 Nitroreductase [Penicillium longicatenatum]
MDTNRELLLRDNFDYDFDKYRTWSSVISHSSDQVTLAAKLTAAYHSLEKGLTIEQPRAEFGRAKVNFIIHAIKSLEKFHDEHGMVLSADFDDELRKIVGEMKFTPKEVQEATAFDYTRFVQARHSVRHYNGESISPDQIKLAVARAIHTPQTVNRKTRRVYAAYDPELREELLSYQRGNIGFGPKLGAVLVVTSDLREFDIIGERNQAWVDGGLSAMSLNFALHASGLGTCMLNWSTEKEQDKALRSAFEIPEYEIIITMLCVGGLPEFLHVAASPAPVADDILSVIKSRKIKKE